MPCNMHPRGSILLYFGEMWSVWTFWDFDVSNVFSTSSQYVHIMFSMCSSPSSQYVHIMFSMCSPPSSQYVHIIFSMRSSPSSQYVLNMFPTKFSMCSSPSSQYVHIMFSMCSPPSSQYVHIKNTCSIFVMGKGKWLIIKQKKFELSDVALGQLISTTNNKHSHDHNLVMM
jgi:hypothetical protein